MKRASFLFLFLLFSGSAQAELSPRAKRWITQAMGAGIGGALGAHFAGEEEDRLTKAFFWSATGAGIASLLGELIFDGEAERQELERKLRVVQEELFHGELEDPEKLQAQGSFPLPPEVSEQLASGKWELYEVDEWVLVNEFEKVHQDRKLMFQPGSWK